MDIKTFKSLAPKLPASMAVLMRGPTGVGKSHLAYATANELGLDLIDSQSSFFQMLQQCCNTTS